MPMVFAMLIGVYFPIMAIGYGLLFFVIEEPGAIFQLLLFYAGLFAILWCVYRLAENPKTKAVTQTILWVLAIAFFVHSCSTHTPSGCVSSRYVDCDY